MTQSELVVTEQRNPASETLESLSVAELVELFDEEDQKAFDAVRRVSDSLPPVIEDVVKAFRQEGRLFYVGAGTSGRLGVLDASECPPTFGTPFHLVQGIIAGGDAALQRSIEGAEDRPEEGAEAICARSVTHRDVVIGIATSGRTPYVLGALQEAHRLGATTVFLSCTPPDPGLAEYVDHFITPIVGPEIVTGSTRLKAGTATKLILNRITTIAMIRWGKVYGNLMVDVQAWNAKLVDRAQRIICEIANVDRQTAERYLELAHRNTKVAVVMCACQVSEDGAKQLLQKYNGFLRPVLEIHRKLRTANHEEKA